MTVSAPNPDRHLKYRPEVDGLRSVAILPVVLYHLGFPAVTGGYVGVDVFFVISGYLITKLIVSELDKTGRFDIANFYVRRLRRLMPAYLATALATLVLGFLLYSPQLFIAQARSAIAATFSYSNFHFWKTSGYFDATADTKPLLHTWSLAVEEQFYLFWPAIAAGFYAWVGRKYLPVFLLITSIASVAIAQYLITADVSAAFYLLPPRAAELGIGGLMVWLEKRQLQAEGAATAVAATGLLLIAVAVFGYTEETPFPGLAALVPCLGTAMFIHSARRGPVTAFFRLATPVWIGRISYSLYLVHWPVIVFYQNWTFGRASLAEQLALAAVCIVLAFLQYRFIEERFRYVTATSWRPRAFVATLAAAAAATALLSYQVVHDRGMRWRVPEERRQQSVNDWRRIERQGYCERFRDGLDRSLFTCQNERGKAKDLYIWGDSHARHLVAGVSEAYPDYNIFTLYMPECMGQSGFGAFTKEIANSRTQPCIDRNKKALAYFLAHPGSQVILSSNKAATPEEFVSATRELLDKLKPANTNVAVLGDFIRPGYILADCIAVPDYLISDARIAARCTGDPSSARRELAFNNDVAATLPEFINPNEVQCPAGHCQFMDGDVLLYMDGGHLNVPGSIYFVAKMKDKLPF
jgi:peptidoglycan/LPS O-acetylase OafA/YrhL